MKVYIDISEFMKIEVITGIQRVVREILIRFLKASSFDTILLVYQEKENNFNVIDNIRFLACFDQEIEERDNVYSNLSIEIGEIEAGNVFFDLDVSWTSCLKRSFLLPILKQNGVKIVAQIYDIMAITHFQYFTLHFTYTFMEFIGAQLLYADIIIVSTKASLLILKDFAQKCGIKNFRGVVAPLGSDFKRHSTFEYEVQSKVKEISKLNKYILMVGTIEPRKNHQLVLKAFDNGLKNLELNIVFAGRIGWIDEQFLDYMYHHKQYGKRIFHIDNATNSDIDYLYKNAFIVAFPTHMEGFGLPLVEAIGRNVPVVATNIDVLKETGKDFCEYFDEDNIEEFIQIVYKLVKKPDYYQYKKNILQRYKPFTWDESAQIILSTIQQLEEV
jgi:Glycosyltransferase